MKQMMMDMMILMMPAMKPLVWIGAAVAVGGVALVILRQIMNEKNGQMVLLAGRIMLGLAVFFLGCQVAGMWLEMAPQINFGDFEKMEFKLVPFWQIGIGFFVVALVLGFVGGRRRLEAAA